MIDALRITGPSPYHPGLSVPELSLSLFSSNFFSMSLAALRVSARRTAWRAAVPRSTSVARARPAFRKYSTSPPETESSKSSSGLIAGVAAAVLLGGGAYYLLSGDGESAAAAKANFVPTQEDYQKVYNAVASLLDEAGDYDDGSFGPVILRLAWHASGTYDVATNTGGSNFATMRFAPESLHGANAGLDVARGLMEKIKAQFPWISYGDLWTLAGVAAVQEMSGPKIPWRPGRIDGFAENVTPDGRLPDATQGGAHLRAIFGRMGFNDQEIVALSGAHALGRCHTDRSGFHGPWTFSPTTLTNDYFKLLFSETWVWKKWNGPKQLEDKKTKSLMMLPTDYVIISDKGFKKYAKAYSEDNDLFFKDFSAVVAKLFELGVPASQWVSPEPWTLQTLDEQKK
ncbi:Peroxidase [Mycena indigotica]|uniref:Peroxidase n=1 Tax=Mycena indigotica TaxID=2126181 RepID=A0A8H6TFK6_9AGAR|nr:Peroxidase [Mycena indigotica]KAF7315776.1 Peroxidase [Mycena indigotica]